MVDFQVAKLADLIADAQVEGRVPDLKVMVNRMIDGRKITFVELKRDYYKKFYPEMVPVAKNKKPNMWDLINSL